MVTDDEQEESLRIGEVIAGKYRIDQEIGRGGMGLVVAATHLDLDQRVAIKILHKSSAYNQDAMARFAREARATAKVRSNHVARVMDIGKFDDGLTYIVMEYLEGSDLAQILAKDGPLRVTTAAEYMLQACEGLAAAHAAGIIHRDIKPANLYLARQPGRTNVLKILDFGVSKISRNNPSNVGAEDGSVTQTGMIFGSPMYMSPEQLDASVPVDGRTDIWALGVVLFELLTGKPPFGGKSSANIMSAILRDPAPKLRTFRPDVPAPLEDVVDRCLDKDRDQRYATVIDLAEAIAPFCGKGANDAVNRIYQILADAGNHSSDGEEESRNQIAGENQEESSSGNQSGRRRSGPRTNPSGPSLGGSSRTQAEPRTQSKRRLVAAGFVGIAVVGLAAVGLRSRPAPVTQSTQAIAPASQEPGMPSAMTTPPAPPPPLPSATAPSPVPSAEQVPNEVTITFTGAPTETKVFRGEKELGTTAHTLRLPRSSEKMVLRFVADTFASLEMELIPNVDQTISITMKPAKPSGTTTAKRKVPKELEPF
jgi:eukaryotic-like serine/threonine-protein kinase